MKSFRRSICLDINLCASSLTDTELFGIYRRIYFTPWQDANWLQISEASHYVRMMTFNGNLQHSCRKQLAASKILSQQRDLGDFLQMIFLHQQIPTCFRRSDQRHLSISWDWCSCLHATWYRIEAYPTGDCINDDITLLKVILETDAITTVSLIIATLIILTCPPRTCSAMIFFSNQDLMW